MTPRAVAAPSSPVLRPLTARSVIASVLLGTHPPVLPVSSLVRVGDLFEIADGTIRVALSRMVADGELIADQGSYRLGPHFETRQAAQDRGRRPEVRPWQGAWELVVVTDDASAGAGLGASLRDRGLAHAGGRSWMRPANLRRFEHDRWPTGIRRLEAAGDADIQADRNLVAALWDLDGWAAGGHQLLAAFAESATPATRFVVAAAILRHLRTDPVLPDLLIEIPWPDKDLRTAYGTFFSEMQAILAATTR